MLPFQVSAVDVETWGSEISDVIAENTQILSVCPFALFAKALPVVKVKELDGLIGNFIFARGNWRSNHEQERCKVELDMIQERSESRRQSGWITRRR